MNLTNEEKEVVAESMPNEMWVFCCDAIYKQDDEGDYDIRVPLDLNDASLVVHELVKQGKWKSFCLHVAYPYNRVSRSYSKSLRFIMTMHNGEATNFFRSYYQWVKENEG